ncbi:MAG: archease [Candidatus Neomarinimicrobiota bacterium]
MLQKQKRVYELFDHTSDLGVIVKGRSLVELFQNSAVAVFDIMSGSVSSGNSAMLSINLRAENPELLLRDWLAELIFLSNDQKILFNAFHFQKLDRHSLEAEAVGVAYSSDYFPVKKEIKAVTYHQLRVQHSKSGYTARFILDI